jgi:uncharacterized protein
MTPFRIGGEEVAPGQRRTVDLPVSVLSDHTPVRLPVHVIHGQRPGPTLFVSGLVHGDEIIGLEVVRQLVRHQALADIAGTLLAVPIVNAFGFIGQSRYLPDRRDLNRSFPGSDRGSLASVLADLFMREIVARAEIGIDVHSAALHRTNYPQIRIAPDDAALLDLAKAFGPPVILYSKLRDGSLRQAAAERGVKVLVFEGGEALRFDDRVVHAAVLGSLRVMKHAGMIEAEVVRDARGASVVSRQSSWLRAPEGGILRSVLAIGERVSAGETVGEISDPLGENSALVVAEHDGIIIGRTNLPVVHRGDALFHIARVKPQAAARIGDEFADVPLADEDEII